MRITDLRRGEWFGPYTHLHHVTLERHRAVQRCSEDERRSIVLQKPRGRRAIGDIHRADIEPKGLPVKIIDHNYAREIGCGERLHRFG